MLHASYYSRNGFLKRQKKKKEFKGQLLNLILSYNFAFAVKGFDKCQRCHILIPLLLKL